MTTYRRRIVTSILGMTLMILRLVAAAETAQTDAESVAPAHAHTNGDTPATAVDTNATPVRISAAFVDLPSEKAPGIVSAILGTGVERHDAVGPVFGAELDWHEARQALVTNACADVLSCPQVITLDGQTAEIKIVQEICLPGPENTGGGSGQTGSATNVTTEEIGVSLTVTPRVAKDGQSVRLSLIAIVKELAGCPGCAADGDVAGDGQSPALISTRTVNTEVVLKDGEAMLLGGLRRDTTVRVEDRVPILGRLPVIGALFSRTTQETRSSDLYILVEAKITKECRE